MNVYIVLRDGKVDAVFSSLEKAKEHAAMVLHVWGNVSIDKRKVDDFNL
jgi:hypothetical protein